MFFASVGRDEGGEVDVFTYYLAEHLGKTLTEIGDMPHAEYVGWKSYYKVKQQQEELASKRASRVR